MGKNLYKTIYRLYHCIGYDTIVLHSKRIVVLTEIWWYNDFLNKIQSTVKLDTLFPMIYRKIYYFYVTSSCMGAFLCDATSLN